MLYATRLEKTCKHRKHACGTLRYFSGTHWSNKPNNTLEDLNGDKYIPNHVIILEYMTYNVFRMYFNNIWAF